MASVIDRDDTAAAESRRIEGQGTPEAAWQAWPPLAGLSPTTLHDLVPSGTRAVVVAPHPDDEVLGCGGMLAMLAAAGRDVLVIGVTDGDASHPGSARFDVERLATLRRAERGEGLRRLGLHDACMPLGFGDGRVTADEAALVRAVRPLLRPDDVVFTTWRFDGHPDHEAVGRASARASADVGCRLREMPVWMWHWAAPGDARVPWQRLRRLEVPSDALTRKRAAIAAHASQLEPDDARDPVLPAWALARLLRPFEFSFDPETAR